MQYFKELLKDCFKNVEGESDCAEHKNTKGEVSCQKVVCIFVLERILFWIRGRGNIEV